MKALKKITAFIGIIILGIGSFYLGSIYNSPKENNQQEVITQNLIAVVNADEGVYIDGKKVNYAADFMDFPNTNFASTGLMDARDGVENGRYAAYDATADMLKDVRESLFTKVSEIDTNPDRKVQSIITNEIVRPIEKNIDAETGRLQKGEKDAQKILWTYLGLLDNYDPLEFVDTKEINGELLKAENSMKEMEDVIEENNLTYYEFVSDVYDTSDENYENLRKEVETHNETSASNIEMTIQQTKEKRSEKNQINTELLNDFAKKLPFTRLGTLENREVNKFIVSPINIEGTEYTQNRAILTKTDKGHLPVAAVAVAAVIILISNFLLIYTKERRSRHETGL